MSYKTHQLLPNYYVPYPPSNPELDRESQSWGSGPVQQTYYDSSSDSTKRMSCLIVGLALAAITTLACYYCLIHGLPMIEFARSNLQYFGGVALSFMGVVFSLVAVANLLYTGFKVCFEESDFSYSGFHAKVQIAASLTAPIIVIPAIFASGVMLVIGRGR